MIISSMSVPQEGHEDFKFLGTSNISRQDIEQLGGSIDCIFLFFYERSRGVMLIVAGENPRPRSSSALMMTVQLFKNELFHIYFTSVQL